jgi:hypothetical protein
VPGRQEAAGLIEGGADEPAVDKPRCRLMLLDEGEARLVVGQPLARGDRKVDAGRVLAAAPTGRVVMRRDC